MDRFRDRRCACLPKCINEQKRNITVFVNILKIVLKFLIEMMGLNVYRDFNSTRKYVLREKNDLNHSEKFWNRRYHYSKQNDYTYSKPITSLKFYTITYIKSIK